MNPARHEVVARAFRRARRQDRRLELEEALLVHAPPDARDHLRTQHDVRVDLVAAQIEEPVAKPLLLRECPACRRPETAASRPSTAPRALSAATSTRPVGSAGLTFSSVRPTTVPATLMTLSSRTASAAANAARVRREHALRDAVVIAQVDEQELAVIALAMHPAGELHRLADVLGAQHGTGVRTITTREVRRVQGVQRVQEVLRFEGSRGSGFRGSRGLRCTRPPRRAARFPALRCADP